MQLFSTHSLALYYFLAKEYRAEAARKMLVKLIILGCYVFVKDSKRVFRCSSLKVLLSRRTRRCWSGSRTRSATAGSASLSALSTGQRSGFQR